MDYDGPDGLRQALLHEIMTSLAPPPGARQSLAPNLVRAVYSRGVYARLPTSISRLRLRSLRTGITAVLDNHESARKAGERDAHARLARKLAEEQEVEHDDAQSLDEHAADDKAGVPPTPERESTAAEESSEATAGRKRVRHSSQTKARSGEPRHAIPGSASAAEDTKREASVPPAFSPPPESTPLQRPSKRQRVRSRR